MPRPVKPALGEFEQKVEDFRVGTNGLIELLLGQMIGEMASVIDMLKSGASRFVQPSLSPHPTPTPL
jgi:hypothetical protein